MRSKFIFLFGFAAGGLVFPTALYLYIHSGAMPVTTADPAMPFEKFIAKTAIRAAIQKQADLKPNLVFSETQLKSGAHQYVNHCAGCHGMIDTPDSKMAAAMFPKSPQLFKTGDFVTEDPVGEIHWKIKNGLRLTGMPAFRTILSDEEMWEISTVLHQADGLSPLVRDELLISKH